MNPENKNPTMGRALIGMVLAFVLAVLSPLLMLTQLFSLLSVIMVPSIGIVLLYRWAGKMPAIFAAMLQMMFTAQFLGSTFMWALFLMTIMPVMVLMRFEKQAFYTQLKAGIASFGAGVVLAVMVLYFSYGGNMIERALMQLPASIKNMPLEAIEPAMKSLSTALGRELTAESFQSVFEDLIVKLIPAYQLNLPGLVFSGALVSAVICVGLNAKLRSRAENTAEGAWIPLKEWSLPSSTTGGLLMITLISLIASEAGIQFGDTVFYTVFDIAVAAFCVQALASAARRMEQSNLSPRGRKAVFAIAIIICLMGASYYAGLYGCMSAIFGSKGALRERMENKKKQNDNH